jgi:hypothetical protein
VRRGETAAVSGLGAGGVAGGRAWGRAVAKARVGRGAGWMQSGCVGLRGAPGRATWRRWEKGGEKRRRRGLGREGARPAVGPIGPNGHYD